MPAADNLLLSFYGDDFTGSTDALESLTRAGAKTVLFIEPPTPLRLTRYPNLRAVGVAGMTRTMTPDAMEETLKPALRSLRALGAPHVHYKVCSTFDSSPAIGSIGRVIDLAVKIFGARFVPLLVGSPALGRYCVFGNLFARFGGEGEIFRLDRHPSMSKHPVTPSDESDLRIHLAHQTAKPIALFDILNLELPRTEAEAVLEAILHSGAKIVLFDVLYAHQLECIGKLIDTYASPEQPLFSVGSSGVEMALGAHWASEGQLKPIEGFPDPGPAEPLLVVSGSCSLVTAEQIAYALLRDWFEEVALDTAALAAGADVNEVTQKVVTHLNAGRNVIVHTFLGNTDPRLAVLSKSLARSQSDAATTKTLTSKLLGSALGKIVRESVAQTGLRRVCVAGGDTSGQVAHALGIEALEMIAPLAPGAPLCRARAPGSPADNLEVVFKGGQVGNVSFFGTVMKGRL
jgi:3-oxoisoapionate kinase